MIETTNEQLIPGVHPKDIDICARETRNSDINPFLNALETWLDAPITENTEAFSSELNAICGLMPPDTDSTDVQMTLAL